MSDLSKIMHVDDDDDIREIARMALTIVDQFDLCQCDSGPAALEQLDGFKPDLLLLDVMMPTMTGPELWAQIREIPGCQDIPTIFMTAKAEDTLSEELIRKGALSVITKPFDPLSLGSQIRNAWATL